MTVVQFNHEGCLSCAGPYQLPSRAFQPDLDLRHGLKSGRFTNAFRTFAPDPPCEVCSDSNQVTLWKLWTYSRNAPAR